MSGIFSTDVTEARGLVAPPADLDALTVVMGFSSLGSGLLSAFFLSGTSAIAGVGYGDGVDVLTQTVEQAQPDGTSKKIPAAFYSIPCTTAGSYGTIDNTGVTGTAVAAVHTATAPYGTDELYWKVITGGFIGTAGITFQYSSDGGGSLSRTTALGTDTSFTWPNRNARIDFSPATADLTALNTLLNELKTDYAAHRVLTTGGVHGAADSVNVVTAANASSPSTRLALVNDLRVQIKAHMINTGSSVHGLADTTDVVTAPVATDDSSALILALNLKTVYNAHIILTTGGVHGLADSTNGTTSPAPVAGAYAAGDIVRCRTFAPVPVAADIDTAFTALANSTVDFGILALDWPMTAALAAHVTTGLDALAARGKKPLCLTRSRIVNAETSESDATWAGLVAADMLNYNDSRIVASATYGRLRDAMTGRRYLRSDFAQYVADVARVARVSMPDVPADRPMANFSLVDDNGTTIGHDEGARGASTGLSNDTLGNRFRCNMRFPDAGRREEVFSTVPWTLFASDERIRNLPTRRIANAMERVAVTAGTSDLGADLFYIPAAGSTPARLTAASIAALQGKIFDALSKEFAGDISNAGDAALNTGLVQVNPNITVTGGNLLHVTVTLAPIVKGYLLSLSFVLAIQE